ncbi:gluconate 2-dehydrogenase subunit 3 family protein [Sphingomonas sp.]|uniref:gluconate 2-dehydrogenase subunit 3 family protein n=1 Tax=Sphingomonas sp. TaxID=28214 RepID=UPI003AFFCEAB
MADRFPGYDVLAKRDTPSWNDKTREVVDERLAMGERADVLDAVGRDVLRALAIRVLPQPEGRPPTNMVAMLLDKIGKDDGEGFRHHRLPKVAEAWTRGLAAIEAEARARHGCGFAQLAPAQADSLLSAIERGEAASDAWGDMPPAIFWAWRMLPDLVSAYYAHPSAWSAIGFGGPASPRGYVRTGTDLRDPWEAAERGDGHQPPAEVRNAHVG